MNRISILGKEANATRADRKFRRTRYRLDLGKLLGRLLPLAALLALALVLAALARRPSAAGGADVPDGAPPMQTDAGEADADFLILVNFDHPVPYDRPEGLVCLDDALGGSATLQSPDGSINAAAGEAARAMFEAAAGDGVTGYLVTTAYRSVAYQDTLYNARLRDDPDYGSDPYNDPVKVMPGRCSEHTTGLAIDILALDYRDSDAGFADTPQGSWLLENAHRFGFILRYPADKEHITGVIYEPWHYRYVGTEAAKAMYESGECLEEYLGNG